MKRFTQIFFSRGVAWTVLLGSSALISISTIAALFGVEGVGPIFTYSLVTMISYFCIAIVVINEEQKAAKRKNTT